MEKDIIKQAVKEVLDEEIKPFFVDRERHYIHHQFIEELISISSILKGTVCGTIAKTLTATVFALLVLGIILWGKRYF